jgi:hypothetical protein
VTLNGGGVEGAVVAKLLAREFSADVLPELPKFEKLAGGGINYSLAKLVWVGALVIPAA